jgi:RNA 2',3'-cyclic 3'-phosphodiesterase
MPELTRTFIGISIAEPRERRLLKIQESLRAQLPECRWVTTMPFHLTLAFLGDVQDTDLNLLCRAVTSASSAFAGFELTIQGLGVFPSVDRPRVLWAGVEMVGVCPLFELRAAVAAAAEKVGYRADDARFHPHVTLGRIKGENAGRNLAGLLDRHKTWSGGEFRVREITTFSSTRGPSGQEYAVLGHAPLKGQSPE